MSAGAANPERLLAALDQRLDHEVRLILRAEDGTGDFRNMSSLSHISAVRRGKACESLDPIDRALIFGDKSTTQQYANNPGTQIDGPGWRKILIGEDGIENWYDCVRAC
jgi:hypothetical protein